MDNDFFASIGSDLSSRWPDRDTCYVPDVSRLPNDTKILRLTGYCINGKYLKNIPKTLHELSIDCAHVYISANELKYLSDDLSKLHLIRINLTKEHLRNMPRGLTALRSYANRPVLTGSDCLNGLPSTLKSLKIDLLNYDDVPFGKLFPLLEDLLIHGGVCDNDFIKLLPSSLQELSVCSSISLKRGWSDLLPPNIKYVSFCNNRGDLICHESSDVPLTDLQRKNLENTTFAYYTYYGSFVGPYYDSDESDSD